jgi:purine-binding chemotaxis protein CheW
MNTFKNPFTQSEESNGKYLTFLLGKGHFGLEILKVREIIGLIEITAVPLAPPHVRGVVNLRGKVIPVVDLRTRFAMPATETTAETCVIVVSMGDREIGVLVDQVLEVQNIDATDIESGSSFDATMDTKFMLGLAKALDHVTILLDIDQVLLTTEVGELCEAS